MWSMWAAEKREQFGSSWSTHSLSSPTFFTMFQAFRIEPCIFFLFCPSFSSPSSPFSSALISNKDEGVALIDIVANESFSSVSLTSQIPGQCVSLLIPLPAGFSLLQPAGCRLAALSLSLLPLLPTSKAFFCPGCPSGTEPQCVQALPCWRREMVRGGEKSVHLPLSLVWDGLMLLNKSDL